jgi:NAD(P)-dependent dehydrogenase (short-subunit alcohol dehydrogenase family)
VADLASLRQVRQLAETFRRRYSTLDVLINNAGVFVPTRTETEDGYETMFQVNYLSPFLLTNLLLEELQKSEQGSDHQRELECLRQRQVRPRQPSEQ